MRFSLRGNVPALLLVAIFALVTMLVATNFFAPPLRLVTGGVSDIRNEFSLSLKEALKLGISELLLNGDSNMTDCWYCNSTATPLAALPPDVNEVMDSSEAFFKIQLEKFLEQLSVERNIEVSDGWQARLWVDGIESNADIHNVNFLEKNLSNSKTVVRITNLFVRYKDGDVTKELDLSGDVVMDYRVWYFYKKLAHWMDADAAGLSSNTCGIINSGSCELTKSTCEVGHTITGDPRHDNYIQDDTVKSMFPLDEMVQLSVQQSVDALNKSFKDENASIECSFQIVNYADNREKESFLQRMQRCFNVGAEPTCTELRFCSMEGGSPDYACPNPVCSQNFDVGSSEAKPNKGCPSESIQPTPRIDWLRTADTPPLPSDSSLAKNNPLLPRLIVPPAVELGSDMLVNCGATQYKVENVTARPEATALISLKCEDKTVRVGRAENFGYLTQQIKLRLALKLNCECKGGTPGNPIDLVGCGKTVTGAPLPVPAGRENERTNFREIACPNPDPLACFVPSQCGKCINGQCHMGECNQQNQCITPDGINLGNCPMTCEAPCCTSCWEKDGVNICAPGVCKKTDSPATKCTNINDPTCSCFNSETSANMGDCNAGCLEPCCTGCVYPKCDPGTCNSSNQCISNKTGNNLGECPLLCANPCPGPICAPPCPDRQVNQCWDYECKGGDCLPKTYPRCSTGTDGYCAKTGCFYNDTGAPCSSNDISANCSCKYETKPAYWDCVAQNTSCKQYYCSEWSNPHCSFYASCYGGDICAHYTCQNEGTPTESCVQQVDHACDGSDDGDICTWDQATCRPCAANDPECSDADRQAGWTCHPLKCPRNVFFGCEAIPEAPFYHCLATDPGGG